MSLRKSCEIRKHQLGHLGIAAGEAAAGGGAMLAGTGAAVVGAAFQLGAPGQ